MDITKPASHLFFAMLALTSSAYAQETGREVRLNKELTAQNPAVESFEMKLRDAEALVKSGKPAEAYSLLEPLEFDHSGEERFDYLIGIAALDSGKADKATLAFERVLMVNPNSAAARLDMARAYYQLGDLPRAKTEFEIALKQNPSEAARVNIEKYLGEIAAKETGRQTNVTGYVEAAAGHDSNVNNSTIQSQIQVYDQSSTSWATVPLDPTNVKAADNYYGVAAGGEVSHRLNANWGLYVGADMRQRSYRTQKNFDSLGLDVRAGLMFGAKANYLRIGLLGGQYNLGDKRNSDAAGLSAEWLHMFSPSNQMKVFGQHAQYRYAEVVMQPNDFDQQAIGFGWLHVSSDGKSTLFGSLYHGMEKDVSTIVTAATPDGGRIDGAKQFNGLRFGGMTAFNAKTTLFANAGMQAGEYSKFNQYFLCQRSDRLYDLTLGANWRLDKFWTLRPQLNYSKNDSNIVVYDFNRIDVSLNIRRDFR